MREASSCRQPSLPAEPGATLTTCYEAPSRKTLTASGRNSSARRAPRFGHRRRRRGAALVELAGRAAREATLACPVRSSAGPRCRRCRRVVLARFDHFLPEAAASASRPPPPPPPSPRRRRRIPAGRRSIRRVGHHHDPRAAAGIGLSRHLHRELLHAAGGVRLRRVAFCGPSAAAGSPSSFSALCCSPCALGLVGHLLERSRMSCDIADISAAFARARPAP